MVVGNLCFVDLVVGLAGLVDYCDFGLYLLLVGLGWFRFGFAVGLGLVV